MKSIKFVTGLCRLSYAHIFQPTEDLNGTLRYSASLIIPKQGKDAVRYKEAVKDLLKDPEAYQVLGKGVNINTLDIGLRDGDEKRADDDAYQGMYFVRAKANEDRPPKVLDKERNEVVDPAEVYSGCYVQAILRLYVYNKGAHKGIGVGLVALRKIKDGKPFTSTGFADSDFDDSLIEETVNELM